MAVAPTTSALGVVPKVSIVVATLVSAPTRSARCVPPDCILLHLEINTNIGALANATLVNIPMLPELQVRISVKNAQVKARTMWPDLPL